MSEPTVPIFEVALRQGKWWSIPAELSQQLYQKYMNNEDAVYTWDWGDSRAGSWQPDEEATSINRYMNDFRTWGAAKPRQRPSVLSVRCLGRRRQT